jgi:hypothetical protein
MYNDKEIIENLKSKITRLERRINELETKFYRENENKQEIIRGNIEIEPYEKRAKN